MLPLYSARELIRRKSISGAGAGTKKRSEAIAPKAPIQARSRTNSFSGSLRSRITQIPLLCLVLALATAAIYAPVAKHEFIDYDDDVYVFDNPHVAPGLNWQTVKWALTSDAAGNWFPLTWISHALDCQIYSIDNAGGHHVTSLLLHVLNAVLLFLFLFQVTGARGRSFVVSALFALHPFNVESVAWVAERKNLLCTVFFLLGLLAYVWYAKRPGFWRYLVIVLCFVFGLASKPMVVTFPFVLLLLDYWPLGRARGRTTSSFLTPHGQFSWTRLALEKVPLMLLSAASAVITVIVQARGNAMASVAVTPLSWRFENALWAYSTYLWKTVLPIRLAPFYPTDLIPVATLLLSAATLLGLGWFAWKFRSAQPYILVGYLWFLGTLVPVIGIVQVGSQSMADRYAYIPLIGVFIALTWGIYAAPGAWRRWLAPATALALIALSVMTSRQLGYWKDSVSLWSHARAVTSLNFVAEEDLAVGLASKGRDDEAFPHFVEAQKILPGDDTATLNIGINLEAHKLPKLAILEFQHLVRYSQDPIKIAEAHRRIGIIYAQAKDFDKARDQFMQAFKLTPEDPLLLQNLGMLEADEAADRFSKAMPAHPTARDYLQLGQLLERSLSISDAKVAYENALKVDPNLFSAQQALSRLQVITK